MKFVLILAALLTAGWLVFAAADPGGVVFLDHEKVSAALAKGGAPILARPDLQVIGLHREKGGSVELHDKGTDVDYIVDGEATFITGGTVVGLKQLRANEWSGTGITGGETHHLTKGDVIVVPAGTPHWFKEVHPRVSYYMVKVLKP